MLSSSSSSSGINDKLIKFVPFQSLMSPTFWGKFDEIKVQVLQLNEDPVPIWGFYGTQDIQKCGPLMSFDNTSFENDSKPYFGSIKVPGMLKTTISLQHLKNVNYNDLMKTFGTSMLKDLFTSEGRQKLVKDPRVFSSFFLLMYADLKNYRFLFWFGFPGVSLASCEPCFTQNESELASESQHFKDIYNTKLWTMMKESEIVRDQGFFAIVKNEDEVEVVSLESIVGIDRVMVLSNRVWFGYLDPCTVDGTPGWMLRNYLAFIKLNWNLPLGSEINVFSYRPGRLSGKDMSLVFTVVFQGRGEEGPVEDTIDNTKFIGWERNDKGSFGPKHVNAQASMDPMKIAENAVDFNLRLMKWRLFPEFDLKMMHETKCLIIGAGTLGCNVTRCLMGWGIRNITFIDNGTVSYSNPVRQSLYCLEDAMNGGKGKAEAAKESCLKIFPGMNCIAEKMMIPMPGHPISAGTVEEVQQSYDKLLKLVQDCDVMYLLTDTRESRWLPTVLGAKYDKLVINAALGFDSYLVMRHGQCIPGEGSKRNLGCYYCTDVVAPGDSTKDRTLDQQCTVTRPGVSMIAAALAVELTTSILHHPSKGLAPSKPSDNDSPLGFIPHSIRGFLGSGEQISPSFQSYDKCTACSDKVLNEFETRGFNFIADVLNNSSDYLEQLTGLDKLKDIEAIEEGIIELEDDQDYF